MTPYSVALAVHVHAPPRGPTGWAAVIRKGDRVATYRGHACNSTEAEATDAARALVQSSLSQGMHYFIDPSAPLSEQARADLAQAQRLARQSSIVVGGLLEVVS